ncbi:hypothetical protein SVAN01_00520 [Stagonosporopsis vannaccii]|nr:hypothetical protein SVAN01_00520 [Stagonosporopsis vannaccii]
MIPLATQKEKRFDGRKSYGMSTWYRCSNDAGIGKLSNDHLKDWKSFRDPVVVNVENHGVVAFYKGKDAPHRLMVLPPRLHSTPAALSTNVRTIPIEFKPRSEEISASLMGIDDRNKAHSTIALQPDTVSDSTRVLDAVLGKIGEAYDVAYPTQVGSLTAEVNASILKVLDDTWQPPSYHKGPRYAILTPLSMRLAVTSAQQLLEAMQSATSAYNEARPHLDPWLNRARAQPDQENCAMQSSIATVLIADNASQKFDFVELMKGDKGYQQELEEAREGIRVKDRCILEVELALHDAEGWTDAVTYRAGQKRLRGCDNPPYFGKGADTASL